MKYVFRAVESVDDCYHNIFESDLDMDALKQLLTPIVYNSLCDKYIRMDNDTFIHVNPYIQFYEIIEYDRWMDRHIWKPEYTDLGTYDTYRVVDLMEGLISEASKTLIRK